MADSSREGGGEFGGGQVEQVIQFRKKGFKKAVTTEEGKARRTEASIKLRREKRGALLAKRRNLHGFRQADVASAEAGSAEAASGSGGGGAGGGKRAGHVVRELKTVPNEVEMGNLATFYDAAMSDEPVAQYEGILQIRRLVNNEWPQCLEALEDMPDLFYRIAEFLAMDRPELQAEAAWILTNVASTDLTPAVVELGVVPTLVDLCASPEIELRSQACWCLGNIAAHDVKHRDMLINTENCLHNIVQIIDDPVSPDLLRLSVWVLAMLCAGKPQPLRAAQDAILPVLEYLLDCNDADILENTCLAFSKLADGPTEQIERVLSTGSGKVMPRLVVLLSHISSEVVAHALRAIGHISTGSAAHTGLIISTGALHQFASLLESPKSIIKKDTLWAISNIATEDSSHVAALARVPKLVENMVHWCSVAKFKIKKEAAYALCNMALTGDCECAELLVDKGAIRPMCDFLAGQDSKLQLVALDFVDRIMRAGKDMGHQAAYYYAFEEVDAIDNIHGLLSDRGTNEAVMRRAAAIAALHFVDTAGLDDEEAALAPDEEGEGAGAHFAFGTSATYGGM